MDLSPDQASKSLWASAWEGPWEIVGDLPNYVDEGLLYSVFFNTGQLVSVKLIRNRATGMSEGYAFLEFRTHDAADQVLKTYNGQVVPGTDQVFRLNWAAYGVGKTAPAGEDHSLFVGDLAPDVSDIILQEYFRQFYPSVRSAKVITDAATGRSKGYGFVRFSQPEERDRALTEARARLLGFGMSGHFLSNRPIRVSLATAKKNTGGGGAAAGPGMGGPLGPGGAMGGPGGGGAPHPSDLDPTNTTLFIGGLSSQVTEEQLRSSFARFGDIIYVKIPQGKGCGFVQASRILRKILRKILQSTAFVLRTAAERAMAAMNGQVLGTSAMRISWGRSSSRAANQANQQQQQQLNGMGGAPFGLGGAFPGFDPAMAAANFQMAAAAAAAAGGAGAMGAMGGMGGMDSYTAAAFGLPGMGAPFQQGYPGGGLAGMNGLGNGGALAGLMHQPAGPPAGGPTGPAPGPAPGAGGPTAGPGGPAPGGAGAGAGGPAPGGAGAGGGGASPPGAGSLKDDSGSGELAGAAPAAGGAPDGPKLQAGPGKQPTSLVTLGSHLFASFLA
eukprot:scaffold8.g1735.t1